MVFSQSLAADPLMINLHSHDQVTLAGASGTGFGNFESLFKSRVAQPQQNANTVRWTNVTNEYEPYTFNDYGSKVPLKDARTGDQARQENDHNQDLEDDSEGTTPTVDIYMAAPNDGDFIFRYGNPNLVLGATPGVDPTPATHSILT